jgi:hypothetical protein
LSRKNNEGKNKFRIFISSKTLVGIYVFEKTEKQKLAERQDTTKHCDARGSTALRTRNAPFSKSPGSPLAATLEKRKGKAAWSARIIT